MVFLIAPIKPFDREVVKIFALSHLKEIGLGQLMAEDDQSLPKCTTFQKLKNDPDYTNCKV